MDTLDDILDTLNLKGALYFRTDFSAPWSVLVPDLPGAARFHLVIQGQCHVTLECGRTLCLNSGDLIMIPRGKQHILSHSATHTAPPLEDVLAHANYDGKGVLTLGQGDPAAATQMVCGHFTFRRGADHPLLRALPDAIRVSAAMRASQPWLDETLRLITRRVFTDDTGSAAAITRLSEVVFVEVLRLGIADTPAMLRMLDGFRDRYIGKALQLMHSDSTAHWTVESLAREIGMSRSRFADRFRHYLSMSPMAYLSEWRLQRALSLLDNSQHSVQQVAIQSGYQSPAAFTRAFTGKFGIAPSEYRKQAC
ncbi:MAG: AraC family transcriptional regulator [Pseudomonadota bacterium]|nr:AraC family transcriptional regulator [Pseudomonadota bacterium]